MGIIIVGAGSVGLHVLANLKGYQIKGDVIGLLDDDISKHGMEYYGKKVIGPIDQLSEYEDIEIILGIAFPKIKERILEKISVICNYRLATLVANSAWVSEDVQIGEGSIIYPNSSINYGSSIGKCVVMNMNCAIGHHTSIGDFSSLAPGVSTGGHTVIGSGVEMGIGSSTIQDVRIGSYATIGGMSMVTKDVPEGATCIGVPGKII